VLGDERSFEFLAVPRSATVDDFRKSLRLLAKKLYPDANQSDPKATPLFPEINAAHEVLGDEPKRRAFDWGESDAEAKSMPETSAIAISEFTFSFMALAIAAAIMAAAPLIVQGLMPQMGINANSDGHLVSSRVVSNERHDPRLWSESRFLFPRLPKSSADKQLVTAAPTGEITIQKTPESQYDHEPTELLIERSERLLAEGDVGAARVLLKRAAEAHDARAALAFGATYDPIMLAVLQVRGAAADASFALDWYARASEFGSREAQERLRLLTNFLVEPKTREMRVPIHVAVSHEVTPHVATTRVAAPTHDRNGVGADGDRVGAVSHPTISPQFVRVDASQKLPDVLGIRY
jgi:curved DNA-binding protein CbpA